MHPESESFTRKRISLVSAETSSRHIRFRGLHSEAGKHRYGSPGWPFVYCATETTSESGASGCDLVICTDAADGITATILRVYCGIREKPDGQTMNECRLASAMPVKAADRYGCVSAVYCDISLALPVPDGYRDST
jgi:hypothetical protein